MNKGLTLLLLVGMAFGTMEATKIGTTEDFFSNIENTQIIGEKTFDNVISTIAVITDTVKEAYNTTTQLVEPVIKTLAVMFDKVLLPMIRGMATVINWALKQIAKLNTEIGDLDIIIPIPVIPIKPIDPVIPPITIPVS